MQHCVFILGHLTIHFGTVNDDLKWTWKLSGELTHLSHCFCSKAIVSFSPAWMARMFPFLFLKSGITAFLQQWRSYAPMRIGISLGEVLTKKCENRYFYIFLHSWPWLISSPFGAGTFYFENTNIFSLKVCNDSSFLKIIFLSTLSFFFSEFFFICGKYYFFL